MAKGDPPARLTFGQCKECPYRTTGSVSLCFECARAVIPQVLAGNSCQTCDIELPAGSTTCHNPLCSWADERREWTCIWAISRRRGQLQWTIDAYKVRDRKGWAIIYGRILAGYLERWDHVLAEFDAVIPMPTYVGDGGRSWDHIKLILERAHLENPRLPVEFGVIEKTVATPKMRDLGSYQRRREVAETALRGALAVPDPTRVQGRSFLVFDDVFTGGLTLREVARALRAHGATEVCGVVLARQPFGG